MIFYFLCLQWDVSNLDIWFLKKGIGYRFKIAGQVGSKYKGTST